MINVKNINKYYNKGKSNEIHVINETSIDLPETGLISFLGESGSGKTTLVNVIGGLDKYTGDINYFGTNIHNYKMGIVDKLRRKNIGYVFQNYNLLLNETVYDNLKIALEIAGITNKEEADKRIKYALTSVGLYKYRKKYAYALSGGQQQRVSIARALIKNSKIIIADEPTGNLDSSNSIEIMNILKKISEKSLVLLVTHDPKLAEFYSDKIIELKDGTITNIRESNSHASLSGKDDKKIYLKDMKNILSESSNSTNIEIYSNENVDTINLTLVEVNGTYYIKSDKKIKLLEDSPLELVNDHYEDVSIDTYKDTIEYDTSWYKDNLSANYAQRFVRNIKTSIFNFFNTRKRSKFFHTIFVLIGVIMAFANIGLVSWSNVNVANPLDSDNLYQLSEAVSYSEEANYIKAYKEAALNIGARAYSLRENEEHLTYSHNTYYKDSYYLDSPYLSMNLINDKDLLWGRMPEKDNEIVLGKEAANKAIKKLHLDNYSDFAKVSDKIVGVTSDKTSAQYYFDEQLSIMSFSYHFYSNQYKSDNLYLAGSATDFIYELVAGSDDFSNDPLYENDNDGVLINANKYKDLNLTLEEIESNTHILKNSWKYLNVTRDGSDVTQSNYRILGYFYSDDINSPDYLFKNSQNIDSRFSLITRKICISKSNTQYKVIEGRDIEADNEILIYKLPNSYAIDDVITYDNRLYTVVGYMIPLDESGVSPMSYVVMNDNTYNEYYENNMNIINSNQLIYGSDNINQVKEIYKKYGFKLVNVYDNQVRKAKAATHNKTRYMLIFSGVLFALSMVYIYFTMRSKMIADIYDIGVMRDLGCQRGSIVGKYIIDIFIITSLTTALGYLVTSIIAGYIITKMRMLGSSTINIIDNPITYLMIPVIFIINIVFGIIPICTLLRKTPSEINSKYDI